MDRLGAVSSNIPSLEDEIEETKHQSVQVNIEGSMFVKRNQMMPRGDIMHVSSDRTPVMPSQRGGIVEEQEQALRVLVVDDNFFNIQVLFELLHSFPGIETTTAYSGEEALTRIDEILGLDPHTNPFDIYLLDVNMPGMDGVQLS